MKIPCALLALWLSLSLATVALAAEENDVCETADFYQGTCILLRQCPELYALLQSRPLPAETADFLRRSQCGFQNRQPLVCCRSREVTTTTTTTRRPPVTTGSNVPVQSVPAPRDVSTHRNIRLINPEFCGQNSDIRIVGGNKTSVFEFPWMALLAYRTRTSVSFRCGGSLMNARYILTAAHCISNTDKLRLVSVRLGEHDTSTEKDCEDQSGTVVCAPPPQNIDVEATFIHPQYSSTKLVNDIALVRLARAADLQKVNVVPICLPVGLKAQTDKLEGSKLIVAGWGATETGISASPDLLKVFVPIVPNAQCHAVFSKQFGYSINGNQMCAGGTNLMQDSCNGDSGGPLMTFGQVNSEPGMIQYGVVSYGHRRCGTEGVPGVYTRVGHYMDWILNTMRP